MWPMPRSVFASMFKNHSLESKAIYQVELIALLITAIICISINVVHATKLFEPVKGTTANNVREQQLQNAIKIVEPSTSSN